jgi:N-acetylmuramoyl-L-alanine amidase
MKIKNHRLVKGNGNPYPFVRSPNQGGPVHHEYLVMHFTAGANADSSVRWLTNPEAKASAHLVIGRNGSITQLVPFNKVAWHAGESRWENRVGLNRYSIGIELDNAGPLTRAGDRWRSWFGREYSNDEVVVAVHKNGGEECGWPIFPEEQITAARDVSLKLVRHYGLIDIVGHDDVAPGRKNDPGPAFPMQSFRGSIIGRKEDGDAVFETTTVLNIRQGPGTQHEMISGGPLPESTQVLVLNQKGSWRFVDVLAVVNDVMDMQGWVHGRFLKKV